MELDGSNNLKEQSDFSFVENNLKHTEDITRPSIPSWKEALSKLISNKLAVMGFLFIVLMGLLAIFVPIFSQYGYAENNLSITNEAPSLTHWFGTDQLGRDIFVRVMYGARYSLIIGFVASFLNLFIGIIYGGIAGFVGNSMTEGRNGITISESDPGSAARYSIKGCFADVELDIEAKCANDASAGQYAVGGIVGIITGQPVWPEYCM